MDPSILLGENTHRDLVNLLKKERVLQLSGLSNETAKALIASTILHHSPSRALIVTDKESDAEALRHWLSFFECENTALHPIENEEGQIIPSALQQFLLFMDGNSILPCVFVCPRTTFDTPFPEYAELHQNSVLLKKGETIHFTELIEGLISIGYAHAEDTYLHPGEYRRTGDVLDVFPIQSNHPYRLPLEFDRVERILSIDPEDSGKTSDAGSEITVFPVLYEKTGALLGQLPNDSLLILDDQDDIVPGTAAAVPCTLRFTAFPESQDHHVHLRYLSVLKFYTLTDFLNDIRDKLQQEWNLFVVTKRTEELKNICTEERIPFAVANHGKSNRSPKKAGVLTLVPAAEDDLLPHSLQNPDLRVALLTDREIFSLRKAGKERSIQKLALDFITSLSPHDYVVHMDHGIARFEGMTQKEVDATMREYLELTYAEGDKLFVPVDQADKLSKYVYEEGMEPHLTRLGTSEWKRVTEKMREETQKIAKELLGLYAERARARGFAFPDDVEEQREFEEAFSYQETPGQLKGIQDIKHDMEDDHPMDRLLCGDVGFGKTEVAMRAAYKAVLGGKQVAILAPITILAHQHYHTIRDRFEGFPRHHGGKTPVRIAMLSRFQSKKEQSDTVEELRKGDVDIVVGTHRLLQPDVKFHNLGLVILDEEQRFGVKQKEQFKEMRANVDILTLTATPIPRTLNLGLHKLRDITTITTPPPGRLPIITEVRKYNDSLIREAILKELERSGQVYLLHNRVETIDAFAGKLKELVPEAKFIVAHGQLKSEDLENRVLDFKEGRFDVLVSSTIIENGIDLPRANTLIVNAAESFGLAQLYQLRGRVGRSREQAYAYFLYHGSKLKEDAKKRLRAIVEACELGSGFQVAMRDLEIRGAGEILGAEQSGTMQTVGVSHFLRMLKVAVEELKAGERVSVMEEFTVEIQLPVEALIPSFYITDEEERIAVYQKLAGSEDEGILAEFEGDLRDEYGIPPEPVRNLFAVLRLKLACRRSGVIRVKMDDDGKRQEIILTLHPIVTAKEIMQLIGKNPKWRISGSTLRMNFMELGEGLSPGVASEEWMGRLTEEVSLLQRKKKMPSPRGRGSG